MQAKQSHDSARGKEASSGPDAIQASCAPVMTTGGIVGPLAGTSWATWKKSDRPTTPPAEDFQDQPRDSAAIPSFRDTATAANCSPAVLAVPRAGVGPWGGSSAAARESLEQLCTLRPRSAVNRRTAAAARPCSASSLRPEGGARPSSAFAVRAVSGARPLSASASKVRNLARPASASAVQVGNRAQSSTTFAVRVDKAVRPASASATHLSRKTQPAFARSSTVAMAGARPRQGPYQELCGAVLLQEPPTTVTTRSSGTASKASVAQAREAHGAAASPCSGAACHWAAGGA
eukprot:TRINITY_DN13804_c0_g1_i2.p1 TRINITY_DN13804_c0_g1~~TRINITY_DN13804_c0_g1_i2.p1  ORF type:complete len:291 (-),score=50.07 TRINITY_DN13804_c0_g1_i2:44-916(-)